jgi:hypothetical protein
MAVLLLGVAKSTLVGPRPHPFQSHPVKEIMARKAAITRSPFCGFMGLTMCLIVRRTEATERADAGRRILCCVPTLVLRGKNDERSKDRFLEMERFVTPSRDLKSKSSVRLHLSRASETMIRPPLLKLRKTSVTNLVVYQHNHDGLCRLFGEVAQACKDGPWITTGKSSLP